MNYDDDPRSIVWTLSARGGDAYMNCACARPSESVTGLSLDLCENRARRDGFEKLSRCPKHRDTNVTRSSTSDSDSGILRAHCCITATEERRIHGRTRILDSLATRRKRRVQQRRPDENQIRWTLQFTRFITWILDAIAILSLAGVPEIHPAFSLQSAC